MPLYSTACPIPINRKMFRHRGSVSPIPQSGLSLWLKADAGVTKFSYNYASQIVISGTSNPSFAGTYTADQVPTWDFGENRASSYSLSGPTGKTISWDINTSLFTATSEAGAGSFSSSNGVSWSPNTVISQFVITGFTGIYSGANGTYLYVEDGYYDRDGGGYYVQGTTLYDSNTDISIATNSNNYQGAWTPTQYFSTITFSNAGETSIDMNGVYTRTDSSIDMFGIGFFASGGRFIQWDNEGGWWFTNGDFYRNYSSSFDDDWQPENGDEPVPTAVYSNSARNVGSPTSTTTTAPTGSISGSVTTSTVNTDNVTGWADQSGNGKNATSFAGEPTLSTFSGKSFVSFPAESGLANYQGIWSETDLIIGTIIMVARFQSSGSTSRLFGHDPTMLFARDQQDNLFITIDDISGGTSEDSLSNNTNYLIGTSFDTNLINFYLNGIDNGNLNGQTQYGVAPYVIGGYSGSSSIAEVVIYNRVLTTPERQQVEAYLNTKYAIY